MISSSHRFLSQHARQNSNNALKVLYKKKDILIHTTSNARPSAVTTILHAPQSELYDTVYQATKMNELDRDALIELLKKFRTFRRLDRSEISVQAYKDGGRALSPHHYSLLMAHANDARQWIVALKYWHAAAQERKLRPLTHAAYLQTLKVIGRWQDAVKHLQQMINDSMPVDAHALHTVMNTTRTAAPWTQSLRVFSAAVASGATPNALVYLVLLRCLSQSKLPNRWHYSLSILESLRGRHERSAGMFNAVMTTVALCGRWASAVQLYHQLSTESIVPSNETFRVLMEVRKWDPSHCVKVLAAAHALGSPVSSEMYRHVLRGLLGMGKADHVAALVEAQVQRAVVDSGNPQHETLPLCVALLDCMLDHAVPENVTMLMERFSHHMEPVIPQSTAGLCVLGQSSQRWIADGGGRIAVVDHNALRSTLFETLRSHYDHVMIPASSIRLLVWRMEEGGALKGTKAYYDNVALLKRLRNQLHGKRRSAAVRGGDGADYLQQHGPLDLSEFVHVLPVSHELFAHRHLLPRLSSSPERDENLRLLRQSASEAAAQLLLGTAPSDAADGPDAPAMSIRGALLDTNDASAFVDGSRNASSLLVPSRQHHVSSHTQPRQQQVEPCFLRDSSWLTPQEKVVSIAVMLKTLNSDVDVHVVSTHPAVLEQTRRWNEHTTTHHGASPLTLTDVRLNSEELMLKAPPSDPLVSAASSDQSRLGGHRQWRRLSAKHEHAGLEDVVLS